MNSNIQRYAWKHMKRTEYNNGQYSECYEFNAEELDAFVKALLYEFIRYEIGEQPISEDLTKIIANMTAHFGVDNYEQL